MRAILAVNLPVIFVQFVFSGVTLAWQIAIFVARFRLMVISSLIEKLTYVGAISGAPGCGDRQRLQSHLGQIYRSSESDAVTTASDEVRSGVR